jgi:chromosome segregation ATPase
VTLLTYAQVSEMTEQLVRIAAEAAAERHSAEEAAATRLQQLEHEHSLLSARCEADAAQLAELTAEAQAAAAALQASTERAQQLEDSLSEQEQLLSEARAHVLQLEADVVSRYC